MIQTKKRIRFIGCMVFALTAHLCFGEVRLIPDSRITAIGDAPLPVNELIRIALVASGVSNEEIEIYIQRLQALIELAPPATGNDSVDGDAILQWMHSTLLTQYVESQTRLDVLMNGGRYNCVSSATLFLIVARFRGMAVHGVLTPDHAFCHLPSASGGTDVETTTAQGFDPGRRREATDSFSGRTGFSYVPPGNYNRRRDIDEKELIALIYQNRIVELQRKGYWEETVGLARDRMALAQTESARMDFLTSLVNFAADADRRKDYEYALGILNTTVKIIGRRDQLIESAHVLLGNAITHHLRANRIDEAMKLLDAPEVITLISSDFIAERRKDIHNRQLDFIVLNGDFTEALEAVDNALADGMIEVSRWNTIMLHLWSEEARRRSSGGQWMPTWEFLQKASLKYTAIPRWDDLMKTYAYNAGVNYHNRFIDAYQKRKWDAALRILEEALAFFPEHPALRRDKELMNSRNNGS